MYAIFCFSELPKHTAVQTYVKRILYLSLITNVLSILWNINIVLSFIASFVTRINLLHTIKQVWLIPTCSHTHRCTLTFHKVHYLPCLVNLQSIIVFELFICPHIHSHLFWFSYFPIAILFQPKSVTLEITIRKG